MHVLTNASNGTQGILDDGSTLASAQEGVAETDQRDIINPAVLRARQALSQLGMGGVIRGEEHNLQQAVSDELQRDRRHTISSLTAAVLGLLVAVVGNHRGYYP